jgi:hypothetical protein
VRRNRAQISRVEHSPDERVCVTERTHYPVTRDFLQPATATIVGYSVRLVRVKESASER